MKGYQQIPAIQPQFSIPGRDQDILIHDTQVKSYNTSIYLHERTPLFIHSNPAVSSRPQLMCLARAACGVNLFDFPKISLIHKLEVCPHDFNMPLQVIGPTEG